MPDASRDQLLRQLRAHRPADHFEGAALAEIVDLLETHPLPFSRATYAPGHVTASALLIDVTGERIGLIRHVKLGLLIQPGGHPEPQDVNLHAAALRELCEETGLRPDEVRALQDTPVDVDVHRIPARPGEPAHCHYDVRFAFQQSSPADTAAVTWVALSEITEMNLWRAARKVLRAARAVAV